MKKEKKKCDTCGKEIPKARLKAVPNTTMCVKCAIEDDEEPRRAFLDIDPEAPHPRNW